MIDAILLGELQQVQQINIRWLDPPLHTQSDHWHRLAQAPLVQEERQPAIVLGQPSNRRYVVVLPGADPAMLERVRPFAAHAFLTQSRRGPYIQAAAFSDRASAEQFNRWLREQGFDARVVFIRGSD